MPSRMIRDGLLGSDAVDALSSQAEVLFVRLILIADDYGRHDARPSILRARLFPLKLDRVTDADISAWLAECRTVGLVMVYNVDGKPFLEIPKFGQRLRAKVSKCPAPADGAPTDDRHSPGMGQSSDGRMPDTGRADDGQMTGSCQTDDGHVSGTRRPESESESESESEGEAEGAPAELPPAAVKTKSVKKTAKKATGQHDPLAAALPYPSPEFTATWSLWVKHRNAIKGKPKLTETSVEQQLKKLGMVTEAEAIACIEYSVANNYQGLFPDDFVGKVRGSPNRPPPEPTPRQPAKTVTAAEAVRLMNGEPEGGER